MDARHSPIPGSAQQNVAQHRLQNSIPYFFQLTGLNWHVEAVGEVDCLVSEEIVGNHHRVAFVDDVLSSGDKLNLTSEGGSPQYARRENEPGALQFFVHALSIETMKKVNKYYQQQLLAKEARQDNARRYQQLLGVPYTAPDNVQCLFLK